MDRAERVEEPGAGVLTAPGRPEPEAPGRPRTVDVLATRLPVTGGFQVEDVESYCTRIYLAVLQQPQPSRALLVAQGMPADLVDHCLLVLASRGLLVMHADGSWEVVSPEVSLPAHAMELEQRARTIRASAHELGQLFYQARTRERPLPDGVRVLSSLDELHTVTADLMSVATEHVISMRDRSPRTEVLFQAPMSAHRNRFTGSDGAALATRAVFDVSVLEIDNAGEVLRARAEAGERARFVPGVPFSAVVVDEVGAVVDVSSYEPTGHGSVLVRSRPLVLALLSLVEGIWRRGTSLDQATRSGLDPRDVAILALLAAGASDTTIARQTRISQRTVERRVRSLMDRLGAATRFQAGVQAARRGWI